jgi:hypothetical protein
VTDNNKSTGLHNLPIFHKLRFCNVLYYKPKGSSSKLRFVDWSVKVCMAGINAACYCRHESIRNVNPSSDIMLSPSEKFSVVISIGKFSIHYISVIFYITGLRYCPVILSLSMDKVYLWRQVGNVRQAS